MQVKNKNIFGLILTLLYFKSRKTISYIKQINKKQKDIFTKKKLLYFITQYKNFKSLKN